MIHGVYAYEVPRAALGAANFIELTAVTEDAASYKSHPAPETVEVLIARQGVANDMLDAFPNAKWLQLLNAGYEKVDLNRLRARGMLFTNARSVYADTIGEDVLHKILMLARCAQTHLLNQCRAFWPDDAELPNAHIDIAGKTLLILGAGAIGHAVAVRAGAMGMRVLGYDRYVALKDGFEAIGRDLKALMAEAHFVVACLPVTDETRGFMDARTFALMRPKSFFINVARGEIVEEDALIAALTAGHLRGAAIDVAKQEPLPPNSPLWTAPNLIITPHRAAYGDQMHARMCALIERNILNYAAGAPLDDLVAL